MSKCQDIWLLPTYILNSYVCIQPFTRFIYVSELQGTLRKIQTLLFVDSNPLCFIRMWYNCGNCLLRAFSCYTIHFYVLENISGSRNIKRDFKNWPDNSFAITANVSHSCISLAPLSELLSFKEYELLSFSR